MVELLDKENRLPPLPFYEGVAPRAWPVEGATRAPIMERAL